MLWDVIRRRSVDSLGRSALSQPLSVGALVEGIALDVRKGGGEIGIILHQYVSLNL